MPIPVTCPICNCKMKAPDSAAGKRVKCPKCGKALTVLGTIENPPRPSRGIASPKPPSPSGHRPERDSVDETGDENGGGLGLHHRTRRPEREIAPAADRASHSLGIASLVPGASALPFSLIPCIGMLSLPLSCSGLLLGIGGGILAVARKGRGIGFPLAGSATSGLALIFGVVWLGFLAAADRSTNAMPRPLAQGNEIRPSKAPPPVAAGTGKTGGPSASKTATSKPPQEPSTSASDQPAGADQKDPPLSRKHDEWVDAGNTVKLGDVRVSITSAVIDYVSFHDFGRKKTSRDKLLMIRLKIENMSETRKLEHKGWSSQGGIFEANLPTLTGNFDNLYRLVHFGLGSVVEGQAVGETIYPGKVVEDVAVYEVPVDQAKLLRLELPAAAFGGTGKVRFQIRASQIEAR